MYAQLENPERMHTGTFLHPRQYILAESWPQYTYRETTGRNNPPMLTPACETGEAVIASQPRRQHVYLSYSKKKTQTISGHLRKQEKIVATVVMTFS